MIQTDLTPHPSDSAFDGVAQGVADGLGRLFPPLHRPPTTESGAARADGRGEPDAARPTEAEA